MGIIIPPYIEGDACSICWGVGKTFGSNAPPRFIICTIAGVAKTASWVEIAGEENNGTFRLEQVSGDGCKYFTGQAGTHSISLFFLNNRTLIYQASSTSYMCFKSDQLISCMKSGVSDFDNWFTGGTFALSIP